MSLWNMPTRSSRRSDEATAPLRASTKLDEPEGFLRVWHGRTRAPSARARRGCGSKRPRVRALFADANGQRSRSWGACGVPRCHRARAPVRAKSCLVDVVGASRVARVAARWRRSARSPEPSFGDACRASCSRASGSPLARDTIGAVRGPGVVGEAAQGGRRVRTRDGASHASRADPDQGPERRRSRGSRHRRRRPHPRADLRLAEQLAHHTRCRSRTRGSTTAPSAAARHGGVPLGSRKRLRGEMSVMNRGADAASGAMLRSPPATGWFVIDAMAEG